VLNPNLNIANAVPAGVRQDAPGGDISVFASQAVDVVADMVGFYSGIERAAATSGRLSGKIGLSGCPAGSLTAFGYGNGITAAGESCQNCSPATVSVLAPNVTCTAHNLVVKGQSAPGSGSIRTFTLVIDSQATNVSCTATDPAIACNSGATSAPVFPGSELTIRIDQNIGGSALCGIEFSWECN
jgi:hypothetical protein